MAFKGYKKIKRSMRRRYVGSGWEAVSASRKFLFFHVPGPRYRQGTKWPRRKYHEHKKGWEREEAVRKERHRTKQELRP